MYENIIWDEEKEASNYLEIAGDLALRSSCLRAKCGSVIVKGEEILGYDKDGRETYEFIEGSTNMHLFSRYRERREFGIKAIRKYIHRSARIKSIEKDGVIWAYIQLGKGASYILVNKYCEYRGPFEIPPSEEEISMWKKVGVK